MQLTINHTKDYLLNAQHSVELFHGRGTYGNGSIDWDRPALSLQEIAHRTDNETALVAEVNGTPYHLSRLIKEDCAIDFYTADSAIGREALRQTGIFLLGYGFYNPENSVHLMCGGVENDMFYYDFATEKAGFSESEIADAQKKIQTAVDSAAVISPQIFPFYQTIRELEKMNESFLIEMIRENDDLGPVSAYVMNDFMEPAHGTLLHDLHLFPGIQICSAEKTANGIRVYAKLSNK